MDEIATPAVRRQLKKVLDRGNNRANAERVRQTLIDIKSRTLGGKPNMLEKIDKIIELDVDTAITAYKNYVIMERKVTDRMDYIVRQCCKIAGCKLSWWDWLSGDCDCYEAAGNLVHSYHADYLSIKAEWDIQREMVFIDKHGCEWGLDDSFPTRWLYEDFEEEFTEGLKAYKEKEKLRAVTAKENKKKKEADKQALLKKVANKLTKEERKLLGIK